MAIKKNSKSAMTLTELIIASVLVGIVTLGLIAAEQAIRMSRQSSNRDAQISAQMQAAMIRLTKDASLTVGDSVNSGIYQYSSGTTERAICFRQAGGDANTYTDDFWYCWTIKISSGNGLLLSCGGPLLTNPINDCTADATVIQWVTLTFGGTYTTFYSVFDDAATPAVIAPTGAIITNSRISYIQLDLQSRFNPAVAAHPIENPEYTLTSRISPPGLSR